MNDRPNLDFVLAEVQLKAYARQFSVEQIEQAAISAMQLFAGYGSVFSPGFCGVVIRQGTVDGAEIPTSLQQK